MRINYSKQDIIDALIAVGIKKGDHVFCHSQIGFFGLFSGGQTKHDYYQAFKEAIFEIIGKDGTFIVPTFSYSFCKGNVFDVTKTPSVCGFLSEMVMSDSATLRSADANFSVAAIGNLARFFTQEAVEYSFGDDSFWDKFLKTGGVFCNFNFDAASTFIHYVERTLNVPYRFDKGFEGVSLINGTARHRIFYHFCYDLDKVQHRPDFTKFDKKAKELGLAKVANLGRGQIVMISAQDAFDLIQSEYHKDPCFLIKG